MFLRTLTMTAVIATTVAVAPTVNSTALAEPLFMDEFDGDTLGSNWEVLNEDPDAYIVEDGAVLIIGSGGANLKTDPVPNIVRLKTALPDGDWVATIKFSVPYQTGREAPFLAIYEDKDNQIVGTTNSWSYYEGVRGARTYLSAWKRSGGKESSFHRVIWGGASGEAFSADEAPNPFYLRIVKKGRTYTPGYRLEGMNQTEWADQEALTVLRPKGGLAFGIYQAEAVKGETPMMVDWFKIEALN